MKYLPNIYGEMVWLRPITFSDTDRIVEWRNNPEVRKHFIFRDHFTYEMHEEWMRSKVLQEEVIQYIIHRRIDNKPIGSSYFRNIDKKNGSAEFGIFIGENDSRGHGYGRDSTKCFIDFGFKELKLHRIMLRLLEDNKRALNSYLAAGFVEEGVFKDMVYLDGEYKNVVFMAAINPINEGDQGR